MRTGRPSYADRVIKERAEAQQRATQNEPMERIYRPYGGVLESWRSRAKQVVVHGPAGTGKSLGVLAKLHAIANKYPGARLAMVRRFRSTITQSIMVTYEQKLRDPSHPDGIHFDTQEQAYIYPNRSTIVVAGLDDPSKVLSTEFDIIYVNECTEIDEQTWGILGSRLRWGKLPYTQLIGDCNPADEQHWIMKAALQGTIKMIQSTHKDSPMLWNPETEDWTEQGAEYIDRLDKLPGTLRDRLYLGLWTTAKGQIYTEFDAQTHMVDKSVILPQWDRYLIVDFGFSNPFCAQWWAVDDDGRMYLYRELYGIQKIVEDWAHEINALSEGEHIRGIICDHDAEGRATLERHVGHDESQCFAGREDGFRVIHSLSERSTLPANKRIEPAEGIGLVKARMKIAGDGKPRIFFCRDAIVYRDPLLVDARKPLWSLEEIPVYIWDESKTRLGVITRDRPRKLYDHGMDCMRYMAVHLEYPDAHAFEDDPYYNPLNLFGAQIPRSYGSYTTSLR